VSRLNAFSLSLLFVLTLILSKKIFCSVAQNEADFSAEKISFGAAVELAVAMPLSWIPLAADYTKNSGKKLRGSLVSTLSYFFTSCWMYTIGMGAAIFTRETDVPKIMANSLGAASLIVVVLSTVTTAFLDAYSAGVSFETIVPRAKGKFVSVAAAAAGTFFALIFNLDNITDFLYLIGGVFLPMISIMAADFFVLKKNHSEEKFYAANFVLWIFGFALYRISLSWNFPLGNSVAVAAIVFFASILTEKILQKFRGKKSL
jgi:putative hydroxymethylpyrimidine transporter CytX